MDPRWLTLIVVGIIVVVILVRQNKIHISEVTVLYFLAIIPSIILHEVTHGWVALAFGDDTAKRAGRLSFNPIVHVSIFGTLILPALLVLSGYPPFGWAKPVPVNMSRMRHPRNDDVVVALAGPGTNIVLAVVAGLVFRTFLTEPEKLNVIAYFLGYPVVRPAIWAEYLFLFGLVNVILAVFNLIPIPPLDGASVLERLLPRQWLPGYLSIRQYTIFLPFLIIWVYPQFLFDIFQPFVQTWEHILGSGVLFQY